MVEKEIVQTLTVPEGITAELKDIHTLSLSNSKGALTRKFKSHRLKISVKGNKITLEGTPANKQTSALLMAIVSHIKNMIEGIMFGYKYHLKIVYSHFPMTVKVEGNEVVIRNFIGEKYPRRAKIVGETKVEIKGEDVTISGKDKENTSQTVSNIELTTKVKGKDIRRYTDGIYFVESTNIEEKPDKFLIEITRGKVKEVA
jgi:large subunit ribosomal protein L6